MPNRKNMPKKKDKSTVFSIAAAIAVFAVIAVVLMSGKPVKEEGIVQSTEEVKTVIGETKTEAVSTGNLRAELLSEGDLKINTAEVTETARFYPYKINNVTMEVFAVKASDGSIKTALNTCQVCYGSGRGYYKQEGDTMVCQNCGNVFDIAYIGEGRNGCNPVPIDSEFKNEEGSTIVISKNFLEEKKDMFLNWTNGL
jgi:Predicted membrane protein